MKAAGELLTHKSVLYWDKSQQNWPCELTIKVGYGVFISIQRMGFAVLANETFKA